LEKAMDGNRDRGFGLLQEGGSFDSCIPLCTVGRSHLLRRIQPTRPLSVPFCHPFCSLLRFLASLTAIYLSSQILQNKKDRCGEIKLRQASDVQKVEYRGKKHCFQIVTPERTYHVCAESLDEMTTWIAAIKAQQQALKGGPAAKAAGAATPTPSVGAVGATGGVSSPAAGTGATVAAAGGAPPGPSNTDAVCQISLTRTTFTRSPILFLVVRAAFFRFLNSF
jgi:hypothetical protein